MNKENYVSPEGASLVTQQRVAILTRSAIGDPESLNHQEQICREYAQQIGLVVQDGYVRSEGGKTGLAQENRPALHSLMCDAKRQPRPFDILMVDEVGHLSRNIGDVLTIVDCLEANGIHLQIVNPKLTSNDPNFRLMLVCFAIGDESYKERLRDQIHNGMKGRVTMGYSGGGSRFGYRNVPVTDDGRRIGHKLQVSESEAAIVRRVFYLSASGLSCSGVALNLTCEAVPVPGKHNSGRARWNSKLVRRILTNRLYVGKVIWNKTSRTVDAETGMQVRRTNAPQDWIQIDAPALRIVSDQTWDRAQERMKTSKGKLASQEVGQPQSEEPTTSKSHEAGALEPEEAQPGAISTSDHSTHAGGYFLCAKDEKISNMRICS